MTGLGHIRAGKLQSKDDLLTEFCWCRDAAKRLTEYVRAIDGSLVNGLPLPDKLRFATRGRNQGSETAPPSAKSNALSPSLHHRSSDLDTGCIIMVFALACRHFSTRPLCGYVECIIAPAAGEQTPNPPDQLSLLGVVMLGAGMLPSGKPVITRQHHCAAEGPDLAIWRIHPVVSGSPPMPRPSFNRRRARADRAART